MAFRIVLAVIVVGVEVLRAYFRRGAAPPRQASSPFESAIVGVCSLSWLLGLALWIVAPSLLSWAQVELAGGVRWAGVAVSALGVGMLVWTHRALGANFSPLVVIRQDHELVTHGPYRYVRHPMYVAFMPLMAGYFLISANVFVGVTGALLLTVLWIVRVPREEQMLLDQFGDTYREYMRRTGRLWPRPRGAARG